MEQLLTGIYDSCITIFNHRIPFYINDVNYSFSLFNLFVFTTLATILLTVIFKAFNKS